MQKPVIACLDLEGVLVPEIWINVAIKTGIEELKITTREMPDYDKLMKQRLAILDEHKLTIADIQSVIERWAAGRCTGIRHLVTRAMPGHYSLGYVLSIGAAAHAPTGYPTLFCNQLEIDGSGCIAAHPCGCRIRKHSVAAFKSLNFTGRRGRLQRHRVRRS